MKERYILGMKLKHLILWLIISVVIFLTITILWNTVLVNFTEFNISELLIAIFAIVIGSISFMSSISALGAIIIGGIMEYYSSKKNAKNFNIVKDKLSNEFIDVYIGQNGFPYTIKDEDIKVMAKLDENNNIVYRIQVDTEIVSDSYTNFLNNFIL